MRNATAFLVTATGLAMAKVGQDVIEWDALWAFVAIAALLGGTAIGLTRPIERVFARVHTRPNARP